ncbi:tyrosine/phenylalanine carboxypeptidase domain-containing protein [Phycisphaerales bacterium AB-hyl4]|uniref:Tyrosine/phenylalanine carboxypeptidase domain-containing protein n=1 Tax=Natronomicrosphaera hydrolytica TaxID=3242702 RepID=A0ABV4UAL7_9BACT
MRDVVSTLITSHDRLLIAKHLMTSSDRLEALVHHEISVHLRTYFYGRMQPMRQFCKGFAAYELLQEGLAVLFEYLVDGINKKRRVLVARVVGTHYVPRIE